MITRLQCIMCRLYKSNFKNSVFQKVQYQLGARFVVFQVKVVFMDVQALVSKKDFPLRFNFQVSFVACFSIQPKPMKNTTRPSGEYAGVNFPERKATTLIFCPILGYVIAGFQLGLSARKRRSRIKRERS